MTAKQIMIGFLGLGIATSLFAGVSVGEKAPAIAAKDQDGAVWNLADHLTKKYLVVYFYPAAMTAVARSKPVPPATT